MAVDADFLAVDYFAARRQAKLRAGPLLRSLLWLTLICVLLAGLGSAWYVYRSMAQVQHSRAIAQQADEAQMLARLLAARVEQQQKVLLTLAATIASSRVKDSAGAARALHDAQPLAAWFDSVALTLADGRLVANMRAGRLGPLEFLDADERQLLQRTLSGGKPLVQTLLPSAGGDLRLVYTALLRTSAGEVVGAIAGGLRLSPQTLLPPAASRNLSVNRLMLVAPDGTMLAHTNPERWLGSVRNEVGLGPQFVKDLQLPVQFRSLSQSHGSYLYTVVGMPLPQWFLVQIAQLENQPLWGWSGWSSHVVFGVGALALLAVVIMALLAYPWMELTAHAAQFLKPAAPVGVRRLLQRLARLHSWGEAAVVWRVLYALSRRRDTQARRAAHFQVQAATILEQAPVALVVTRQGRIELLGTQAARMFGYLPEELQGYSIRQLCAGDEEHRRLLARIYAEMNAFGHFDDEVCFVRKDGSTVWMRLQGRRVAELSSSNAAAAMVWQISDVSDLHQARLAPDWQQTHDALTQLPNREALAQRLQQLLNGHSKVSGDSYGVLLFLDLDHFASVNDMAGHDAGDVVLRHFARLLEGTVRAPGWLARLGGDEFAVLLPDVTAQRGRELADQLCAATSAWDASYRGQRFWLGVSIGMVVLDAQQTSVAVVLHAADMACYEAKRLGRGRVHKHCPEIVQN